MDNTLKFLADNPDLFKAVKEKFEAKFSLDATFQNHVGEFSERELGEKAKAILVGKQMLTEIFAEIDSLKTVAEDNGANPAR